MANEAATPVRKEHTEKAAVARISRPLREPVLSDTRPIPKAAIAHVNDSAPARIPTCVLLKPRSGWMKGIRKFDALRSKKTMPKFTLRSVASMTW